MSEAPSTAEGVAEAAEEPKPVLIWRPGRFEGRKRDSRRDAKPGHDGTKRQGHPSKAAQAGKGRPDKHRRNEDGRKAFKGQPGGRPREERPARIDPDSGRFKFTRVSPHLHAFKVPTLRNVELTAPYMHNGVYRTLEEVVDFYNRGGGAGIGINLPNQTLPRDSLGLSQAEQRALVTFMRALTDTAGTIPPREH